jgi:hypothetical protein
MSSVVSFSDMKSLSLIEPAYGIGLAHLAPAAILAPGESSDHVPEVQLTVERPPTGGWVARAILHNPHGCPIRIEGIRWRASRDTDGPSLLFPPSLAPQVMATENFRGDYFRLGSVEGDRFVYPLTPQPIVYGQSEDHLFPGLFLVSARRPVGLFMAQATQKRFYALFRFLGPSLGAGRWFFEIEERAAGTPVITLPAGGSLEGEAFYFETVATADPQRAAERYYAYLRGSGVFARRSHNPLPAQRIYCSWNYDFMDDITEAKLLGQIPVLQKHFPMVKFIQLDDGYQGPSAGGGRAMVDLCYDGVDKAFDPVRFPSGPKALVDRIRAEGFRPAIWVGLWARLGSRLVQEHPDWILRDDTGEPLLFDKWYGGTAVLDPSVAGVRAYLERLCATLFGEWGFEGVKLDFSSFAFNGRRVRFREEGRTAIEWRHEVERIFRRYLPRDGFFGWCVVAGTGQPFLLQADYFRNAVDIGWGHWETVRRIALWTANTRMFMPEAPCLPNLDSVGWSRHFDETEWLTWLQFAAVSGGALEVSGDLRRLPEERLKRLAKTLELSDPSRRLFTPGLEWIRGMPPPVWVAEGADEALIGVFNWGEEAAEVALGTWIPDRIGVEVREVWDGRDERLPAVLRLPAHGSRLWYSRQ